MKWCVVELPQINPNFFDSDKLFLYAQTFFSASHFSFPLAYFEESLQTRLLVTISDPKSIYHHTTHHVIILPICSSMLRSLSPDIELDSNFFCDAGTEEEWECQEMGFN
jgi:hypothetical protein